MTHPSLQNHALVVKTGRLETMAGIAGEDQPRSVVPSVVGFPPALLEAPEFFNPNVFYVGHEALQLRGYLRDIRPLVKDDDQLDWTCLRKVWKYLFETDQCVNPTSKPILWVLNSFTTPSDLQHARNLLLEDFQVPNYAFIDEAVAILVSTGRTSGCVVNIGTKYQEVIPIWEGMPQFTQIKREPLGGSKISEFFLKLVSEGGSNFHNLEQAGYMKERICEVFPEPDFDPNFPPHTSKHPKMFQFPDGEEVTVREERFIAPEILFTPNICDANVPGLHESVSGAINECKPDIQPVLFNNIVLAGGSTMFRGLRERLHAEISRSISQDWPVKVIASPERKYSAWIGASILASLNTRFLKEIFLSRSDEKTSGVISGFRYDYMKSIATAFEN